MHSISEILAFPDGCPVEGFEGSVAKSFGRATGESAKGPWTRDDYVISDGSGAEVKVRHWNSPHGETFNPGQRVTLTGRVSEYNGTKSIQVNAANMHTLPAGGAQQAPPPSAATPAPAASPAPPASPTNGRARLTVSDAIALANRVRRELSIEGWADDQAIMAHANTILIGWQRGDIEPDPEPTDDDIPF